ncbi:MAG: hypothetical protein HKN77_01935 [Woeseiaceae bacterium]|nr:hypothetical protein [Woeseiaceae bacterium]
MALLPILAACGGGGGGSGSSPAPPPPPPPPVNSAPTSNAGPDLTVSETTTVNLDGSASSDPDAGDTLTYTWTQMDGQVVTINNNQSVAADFEAPDVAAGAPEALTFQLEVSDGSLSSTDTVVVTVQEGQPIVTISGKVNYEFVPPNFNCNGLDFLNTETRPIRGATVQLVNVATGTPIATTSSDDVGDYSFSGIPATTDVRLRVLAQAQRTSGLPNWDLQVRDNTDSASGALPNRALYVVDGTNFNTGGIDRVRNLTATTGWGVTSYTGPRSAAPFAILDAMYSGMQLILTADPQASFAPLDAYWSVNNTMSSTQDIDNGELGASFYTSNPDGGASNPSLFLLGDANSDTEEFDDHVVVHEWGHYFEDNFSRSDSIGGPHALGQSLDARLAFGEGFATALAAMALDDPQYCDTGRPGSTQGFGTNAETDSIGIQGWFNEISVTTLLYDLWDTNDDGADNNSIGFAPIFETMVGPQANTEAFTTVFSFAAELRSMVNPALQSFIDLQLTHESINPNGIDIWGSTETNNANGNADALPLYTDLTADGSVINICTNSDFDRPDRTGNKLAEDRYIRLSVPATDTYDVLVNTTTATPVTADPDDRDQSDPDIFVYRDGSLVAVGQGAADNTEAFVTQNTLIGGEIYSVYLEEWRFEDEEGAPADYPEQICFDVSFTATP